MNRRVLGATFAASFLLSSCQGRVGAGGPALSLGGEGKPARAFAGRLTDARCYFNTKAVGGDHEYCAFMSARANLPLVFLADEGGYSFVTNRPSALSRFVTKHVLVEGELTANRQLLRVDTVRDASSDLAVAVAP
jgi:hypothetical protein